MNAPHPVLRRGPEDPPERPRSAAESGMPQPGRLGGNWHGPTYYGRPQLKPAPFEAWVVGGYVFLAGLSGAGMLISTAADLTQGRAAEGLVRRGRYAALLAPTLGSLLLVYDLHTPERFYNMFRVAKATSPMSIGTWILTGFTATAAVSAGGQFAADCGIYPAAARGLSRAASLPAAAAGAGLSTYTAALFAATSTPLWAAAPRALAARFGSSSIATGAAALWLGEADAGRRRALETLCAAALAVELAAGAVSGATYRRTGVAAATHSRPGRVEKVLATGLGAALPLGLYLLSRATGRRPGPLSGGAALGVMAGSALLRVSMIEAGALSARRPDVSLRFAQPENLPEARHRPRPA